MNKLVTLFLPLLLIVSLVLASSIRAQNWQLVWADEFNGSIGPDWVFETGNGSGGWGNNELEYYQQQNATIENGTLVITARQESVGGFNYTSARMKTQGQQSWTYGRIEARISLPSVQGLWPAFWMLGNSITSIGWPACGEIDIMEHINTETTIHGTIHWDADGYANYGGSTSGVNVTNYHVYAIEWDESEIRWYLDGVQYHVANILDSINSTEEFHQPFFIILNLAVGGNWPGFTIDTSQLPATMRVDYVRVYQDGAPTGQTPYTGSPFAIPGAIEAEQFDNGGEGVAYHDVDASNNGGAFRPGEGVDIESSSEGAFNVGWMEANEWLEYTVNVASAGTYDVDVRVASQSAGGNFHIEFDGGNVTGTRSFAATEGWQNWITHTIPDVNLPAGQHVMRFFAESSSFNLNYLSFTATVSNSPPVADAGSDQTVTDSNNNGSESVTLNGSGSFDPDGSITSYVWTEGGNQIATGVNPSVNFAVGTHNVTLTVTDNNGATDPDNVMLTVNPGSGGTWTVITYDDFEGGLGNYNDGGGDMSLYTGGDNAHQGNNAANIQDNSGTSSSFFHSSGHDVTGFSELEVEFWYYAVSMDSGEDFLVQFYDGSNWQTVATFAQGTHFSNNQFNNPTVSISSSQYNFPSNAQLRFMCDASSNSDDVYIDEIEFRGSGSGSGGGNLAQNRPVTVSSVENASFAGANAVDGNGGTRWSSAFSDPQWIQVDLGATANIGRVVLGWEAAYGSAYSIEVSDNAVNWVVIYSTSNSNGGIDDITTSGSGRYVRMLGVARATQWGYSLWEFEIYGSLAKRSSSVAENAAPASFELRQNYPNPFNPETQIQYQLPQPGMVQLAIYDVLGHRVRTLIDEYLPAGPHTVRWNALDDAGLRVASGIYIYRINVTADSEERFTETRRMLLLR